MLWRAKSDVPVKGLAFYVEALEFEDNLLDLVPGDEQIVIANGLNGRAVNWRFYGTSIVHTQGK